MNLDPQSIASRYALREGCRFIGYQAVGISVFSINVRVLAIEQRPLPPIDEFVLRFLLEGVAEMSSICGLLGLDQRIVRSSLVELRRAELIEVRADEGDQDTVCVLTDKGKEAAQSLRRNVMQEMTIPNVIFHGLLRQPVQLGGQARRQYLKPKDARDQGLTLVRAIPNRPPNAVEIDADRLDRILKSGSRRRPDDPIRDVVAVRSVLKKAIQLYEPAVMLEYETEDKRRERQVGFAVEGRLVDDYERAFARLRGPELLADILTPDREPIDERLRKLVPAKLLSTLGKIDDAEELTQRVALARQQLSDAELELKDADRTDTRQVLREQVAQLQRERDRLEQQRSERKLKYLWTPEIKAKFWEALQTAQERLLILSGFLSAEVVDTRFVETLRAALSRGVKIWIGYGFDKQSARGQGQREADSWRDAERSLEKLRSEFPKQFIFRDVGRSHEKRLICDNRFTFGGSFNLLSFSGDNRGGGAVPRHEGADLIEDAAFCEELYGRYLKLFFKDSSARQS